MSKQTNIASAIYPDMASARRAVAGLIAEGVPKEKIALVSGGDKYKDPVLLEMDKKTLEEVHQVDDGFSKGAALGGFSGLLLGLGIITTVPGIGLVIAAGGLLSSVVTCAAVGGLTGGLLDSLAEIGLPQEHAQEYGEAIQMGHVLVVAKIEHGTWNVTEKVLSECGALSAHECVTHE